MQYRQIQWRIYFRILCAILAFSFGLAFKSPVVIFARNLVQIALSDQITFFGANTRVFPQDTQDRQLLEPGRVLKREIEEGVTHTYQFKLGAARFTRISIKPKIVELAVKIERLSTPGVLPGIVHEGTESYSEGLRFISLIASETTEKYRLTVTVEKEQAASGSYEVSLQDMRPANQQDQSLVVAERTYAEAIRLRKGGSPESEKQAVKKYQEALDHFKSTGDLLGASLTHIAIGQLSIKGQYELAERSLKKALELANESRDQSAEAIANLFLGDLDKELNRYEDALKGYRQANSFWKEEGELSGVAETLYKQSEVFTDRDDRQQALSFAKEALGIYEQVKYRAKQAEMGNNIGGLYDEWKDYRQALDYYRGALRLYLTLGYGSESALTLNNLSRVCVYLGETRQGIDYLLQALPLWQKTQNERGRRNLAMTYNHLGKFYSSLNEGRLALFYANEALQIYQELKDKDGEAKVHSNLGESYLVLAHGENQALIDYLDKSLSHLNRALALRSELKQEGTGQEAATLALRGQTYLASGQNSKAMTDLGAALLFFQKKDDPYNQALTLNRIGRVFEAEGDSERASDSYARAFQLMQNVQNRPATMNTLLNLARVQEQQSNYKEALKYYAEASRKWEEQRVIDELEEFKISRAEEGAALYRGAALSALRAGQKETAFDYSERARARAMLDRLRREQPKDFRSTADPELLKQEQALQSQIKNSRIEINQLFAKMFNRSEEKIQTLTSQLAKQQEEYNNRLIELKLRNSAYRAGLRSEEPFSLDEIKAALNEQTTLLSYLVTPENTVAFAITHDEPLRAFELNVKEADLADAVIEFRGFASLKNVPKQNLRRLYSWLVEPLKQHLKTPVLGVIPSGILRDLPFEALLEDDVNDSSSALPYLGNRYAIFYLPSASVLPALKRKPESTRALVVSQSRIEGVGFLRRGDQEAHKIAELFKTQPLLGNTATASRLSLEASKSGILHLVAHCEVNLERPLFSRFILAGDDNLDVHQIYDLNLERTHLVVLSGAQTNLSVPSRSDEVVSLSSAFLQAGASSVIASLWAVDDEATANLMKVFYQFYLSGMSKASALQAAQAKVREQYSHPYYWAAFVLTGEPGGSSLMARRPGYDTGGEKRYTKAKKRSRR